MMTWLAVKRSGVDLVTVAEILGHADIKMTMRYAHPTPENMQRAVDKLREIFEANQDDNATRLPSIELKKQMASLSVYN